MENDNLIILDLLERIIKLEKRVTQLETERNEKLPLTRHEPNTYTGKRYQKLTEYLLQQKEINRVVVKLTFSEIANIIKIGLPEGPEDMNSYYLPESSRTHRAFWANTDTHSIALSWKAAGYLVSEVHLPYETENPYIIFKLRDYHSNL